MDMRKPMLLLFETEPRTLIGQLNHFIAEDMNFSSYGDHTDNGAGVRIILDGITLSLECISVLPDLSGMRAVFADHDPAKICSAVAIGLDRNVAGGEKSSPIVSRLLKCGSLLASGLGAKAVAWLPSNVISSARYFSEAVTDYVNGGAFPALALIDFAFSDHDRRVQTAGLGWFSGQEIELKSDELSQAEMMRRLVRVIHDIAVNGPIKESVVVEDLDLKNQIAFAPSPDRTLVVGTIRSIIDRVTH